MSWVGFVDAEGAGYVPRNNSPRIGFNGFFSLLDYILLTNESEVVGDTNSLREEY
jgi:hypothetical protein